MFTKLPHTGDSSIPNSSGGETTCDHRPVRRSGIDVVACAHCGEVAFRDSQGPVAAHAALGRLFGSYDLVTTLPAVHAPGDDIMLYRPPRRTLRSHLDAFAPRTWFSVDDGLWLSHDGDHLLLATGRRVIAGTGA
jgi:hypothetical protein